MATWLITGCSTGLGRALAAAVLDGGDNVVVTARDAAMVEDLARSYSDTALALPLDVTDHAQRRDVVRAARERFGAIDVLVNNAGTSNAHPFETVTDADWQEDLDLKLFAAIRLTRLAWPYMKEQKWGRIINVLNIGAKAPRPASAPTSVTRAAGMALTKVLAGEGAPHGILVNALLVGFIESDQWVQRAAKLNVPVADFLANMGKEVPLGRVGTAQEFANVAFFLASDAASYLTGAAINVDGDRSPVV